MLQIFFHYVGGRVGGGGEGLESEGWGKVGGGGGRSKSVKLQT